MPNAVAGDISLLLPEAGTHPLEVARCWPADTPLLMLISGRRHPRWARWTILAPGPSSAAEWLTIEAHDPDPLARLRAAGVGTARAAARDVRPSDSTLSFDGPVSESDLVPFSGGWIGTFGYELGRAIEPAVRQSPARQAPDGGPAWPIVELARCDTALIHDGNTGHWHAHGPRDRLVALAESMRHCAPRTTESRSIAVEELVDPRDWTGAVRHTVELIRAGDLFQANVSRPLRVRLPGDHQPTASTTRAIALKLLASAQPWHGALLELPGGRSIVSLSPELFLAGSLRASGGEGHIVTRPIKGTSASNVDPALLLASSKDEAELVMIVDLMRNDLGRVCMTGSVRVTEPRMIETHPTINHGVATVEGRLRPEIDLAALLAATFPPGSVTGAPKIRAMQVIETLEPFARGPYCGAIGLVGDDGHLSLNVAIRTLAIRPDPSEPPHPADPADPAVPAKRIAIYGVGCGIVADSDPAAELQESLDKARVLVDAQC